MAASPSPTLSVDIDYMPSKTLASQVFRRCALPMIGTGLLCCACASLPPEAAKFDNFSDYAEAVFKHQNQIISRMMLLDDSEQLPDSDELDQHEQAMRNACHLLNEYAEKEIDGEFISPFFTQTVQDSIEGCDKSLHQLEKLLDKSTAAEHPSPQHPAH